MCSSYTVSVPPEELMVHFKISEFNLFQVPQQDLRPTDSAPAHWNNKLCFLKWGIPSPWDGKPLINARSETLEQKQTFYPLLNMRCLIPANSYYEWRQDGPKKRKNCIKKAGGSIFSFAGLTDGVHFSIVTCAPITSIKHIHDRMPAILTDEGERAWIDKGSPFKSVKSYLNPNEILVLSANENMSTPPRQPDLFSV